MSGYHKEAPLQRPNWADALLVLESGVALWGRRCGAYGHAVGELCFNTALTGYQEVISDPSYADQIITFTTPHIGNVGVNDLDREHPRAACKGVVLREAPTVPANYRAERSLEEWLTEQGVIGICGVDTRALTSILREGAQRAMVMSIDQDETSLDLNALLAEVRAWEGLEGAELSLKVTGEKSSVSGESVDDERAWPAWSEGDWVAPESAQASPDHAKDNTGDDATDQPLVLVVDFGAKDNIMRCLVDAGCRVELVNPESDAAELLARNPNGVCLSNGPGDPAATLTYARPLIEGLLARPELPIFGICLGHQVLALTLGARTAKMTRGHRGANHPILNLETARVEITSQNHGFVVTDLPEGVTETHRSLFDGTIAGLKLEGRPVSSVQYHPEASPGPHDSRYLFEAFAAQARAHQAHTHQTRGERDTSSESTAELAAQIESARPALVHASRLEIKPRRIMIVGAGPIVIGQACEFDYSGAQACKSLRSSGHEVILVNSNPATIMTDPQLANRTYIEPLTVPYLTEVIRVERPDALLPTMGGQTALNVCLELAEKGVLDEFNVEMIGARAESIETAEDRLLFREAMDEIGLASPISRLVTDVEMAVEASEYTGFPAIIRPSFTLGGSGGGIAEDLDELREIVARGIKLSPVGSVLIEESLLGWKEYELEVVRDRADNGIIICSIENIDPMGIHTGDSITVAPSLTLTDKEQQRLRDQAINCLRRVGVDTGGSNVQFSVNPKTGRAVVIEMNPRVSRSSALASKATGFPIAKVAAQLAVGHTLDELQNEITRVTPASFEPSIDYIVVKIPRFTFEKFSDDVPELNTSMKSVGEVMALGRSFSETLQKALRGLEVGYSGLDDQPFPSERADQLALLEQRIPYRLLLVAQGLRVGLSVDDLAQHTGIDPWYIRELEKIVELEAQVKAQVKTDREGLESIDAQMMLQLKRSGLSDKRLATLLSGMSERDASGRDVSEREVRARRWALGIHPNYRRVDTCAAEFESHTQYLYSSYELSDEAVTTIEGDSAEARELASTLRSSCEAQPSERKKVIILGGGPNRIGQGIEFDYCCVHAAYAIRDAGYESIMVNCNPETVSTDYDTADRLYFEPLSAEDVIEVARVEASRGELLGVIVQLGGQTPLNLAEELEYAGIPILGTPRDVIDRAEDRARFQALIEGLELRQPKSEVADDVEHAARIATEVGYPVLLRPSYVLGGRAMRVVEDEAGLREYIDEARKVSVGGGVLIDQYLTNAIEVDVDALCDGSDVWVVGVMEHIEEAGVHSGDSACSLPPYSLSDEVIAEIKRQAEAIALELGVVGLMNIQFAVSAGEVYLIEVNPRASRTVPFVAKTYNIPVARIATQLMLGSRLSELELPEPRAGYIAVKEAVFPFARFPNADLILGPEMLSTGEVMGWDLDFGLAYAKAQIAAGMNLPETGGVLFTIGDERLRSEFAPLAAQAHALGYAIYVTPQTHEAWSEIESQAGAQTPRVLCEAHEVHELFKDGKIQLLISVDHPHTSTAEAAQVRRAALATGVPYFTRLTNTRALIQALKALAQRERPSVHALQD